MLTPLIACTNFPFLDIHSIILWGLTLYAVNPMMSKGNTLPNDNNPRSNAPKKGFPTTAAQIRTAWYVGNGQPAPNAPPTNAPFTKDRLYPFNF